MLDTQSTVHGDGQLAGHGRWEASGPSAADTIETVLGILRRQRWLIAFLTVVGVAIGALYIRLTPPVYIADAHLSVDTRKVQLFQQPGVLSDAPVDTAAVENQLQALRAEKIGLAVVNNLQLAEDPEFAGASASLANRILRLVPGQLVEYIPRRLVEYIPGRLVEYISNALRLNREAVPLSESERAKRALFTLEKNLKVERQGASLAIAVSYRSANPERAAQVANAVVDAYLADQSENRSQTSHNITNWLQNRISELGKQSEAAEKAVADLKIKNNIVTANGRSISEEEINQLSTQLIATRGQATEAKARLDRIEAIVGANDADAAVSGAVADSLNNPIITKLRTQYLECVNREADISNKYGANHLAAVELRRQIRAIRASMLDELTRIAESYRSDYEIANQRRVSLEKSLAQAASDVQVGSRVQTTLRELEFSAQTYRALHDNFLQRYTQSIEQEQFPVVEARRAGPASPPLEKSGPKELVVMALASLGGLGLGFGLGLVRELMDRVFRTVSQVERILQSDCLSVVPSLGPVKNGNRKLSRPHAERGGGATRMVARTTNPIWSVVDQPFSRFAESIRAIKLAGELNGSMKSIKVMGITSSLPNEGKSTLAASLGFVTAQAGGRVILVDCDLRNPSLTGTLAPHAEFGFVDVISGRKLLEEVVWVEPSTNLVFLPTVGTSQLSTSSDILAGSATRAFFQDLRQRYDYIIVDLSPIAPVIDVRATTQFVDSFVFVIEWGRTKIDVVRHALSEARGVQQNLLGVVLNKASIRKLSRFERHKQEWYHNKRYARYGASD